MSTKSLREVLETLVEEVRIATNKADEWMPDPLQKAYDAACAALAQRADEPAYDAEFIGLQREELASLPDAAVAEAFRDIAGRNYRKAHASLFRAHVIEKARTFATAAPAAPAYVPLSEEEIDAIQFTLDFENATFLDLALELRRFARDIVARMNKKLT